jgi:hypothetical protein
LGRKLHENRSEHVPYNRIQRVLTDAEPAANSVAIQTSLDAERERLVRDTAIPHIRFTLADG